MERNFELSINLSEEVAEKFGIDENTEFDTYYEDGRLVIAVVDEDEEYYDDEDEYFDDDEDEYYEDEDDEYIDCDEIDCEDCEYCCPHFGECTLDDPEVE